MDNSGRMEAKAIRRGGRLKQASQAEILRSHQRDEEFVKKIQESLSELVHNAGAYKVLLRYVQSDLPAKLAYFAVTTGMNNQTLGEEYTGIVQADLEARKVPPLSARILAMILECFGEKIVMKMLERLQASVNHSNSELTPAAVSFLNTSLTRLRTVVPLMTQVHRGLFYVFGKYYSLGRRLTGVDYAKVYGQRPSEGISWGFRLLGVATLLQCTLKLWRSQTLPESNEKSLEIESSISGKCQLCLERTPTTATPCGHLFCWQCLADWLCARPQCPLCREHVTSSRIIHLLNA